MAKDIHRYARTKKLLGQILKEMKAVHEGMIQEALQIQRAEGGQIGQILVRQGHLDESTLQQALARQARESSEAVTERHHAVIGGERRLMAVEERPFGADGLVGLAIDRTDVEELQTELTSLQDQVRSEVRAGDRQLSGRIDDLDRRVDGHDRDLVAMSARTARLEGELLQPGDQRGARQVRERLEALQQQGYWPGFEALARLTASRPVLLFEHTRDLMLVVDEPGRTEDELNLGVGYAF